MQQNQDVETSTDKVQRENKRLKKLPMGSFRFSIDFIHAAVLWPRSRLSM